MSATVSRPVAACWLHLLLQRRPHQVVGPTHAPYLMRWFVLPHNRFVNVYVQTFASSGLLTGLIWSDTRKFVELSACVELPGSLRRSSLLRESSIGAVEGCRVGAIAQGGWITQPNSG